METVHHVGRQREQIFHRLSEGDVFVEKEIGHGVYHHTCQLSQPGGGYWQNGSEHAPLHQPAQRCTDAEPHSLPARVAALGILGLEGPASIEHETAHDASHIAPKIGPVETKAGGAEGHKRAEGHRGVDHTDKAVFDKLKRSRVHNSPQMYIKKEYLLTQHPFNLFHPWSVFFGFF